MPADQDPAVDEFDRECRAVAVALWERINPKYRDAVAAEMTPAQLVELQSAQAHERRWGRRGK